MRKPEPGLSSPGIAAHNTPNLARRQAPCSSTGSHVCHVGSIAQSAELRMQVACILPPLSRFALESTTLPRHSAAIPLLRETRQRHRLYAAELSSVSLSPVVNGWNNFWTACSGAFSCSLARQATMIRSGARLRGNLRRNRCGNHNPHPGNHYRTRVCRSLGPGPGSFKGIAVGLSNLDFEPVDKAR